MFFTYASSHFKAGSRSVSFTLLFTRKVTATPVASVKSSALNPPNARPGSTGPPYGAKQSTPYGLLKL